MERNRRHAAFGAMFGEHAGKHRLGLGIEAVGRLIQQPKRRPAGEDSGESQAPALPRGEKAGRESGEALDAESSKGGRHGIDPAPEGEILGGGQRRFQRVEMTQEGQPPAVQFGIRREGLPTPGERPLDRPQQSRHQAQQARFSAAVRPAQHQQSTRLERKIQARENHSFPAPAGEIEEQAA